MATGELGYLDYLKAAFHRRVRVPLLGALPLNYLGIAAFGVLGIANPGFLLVGAAAELAYLYFVAGSPRFQKLLQGERLLSVKESWDSKVQGAIARLSRRSQERYYRLLEQCRQVQGGIAADLDEQDLGNLKQLRAGGLNQMLWIFLRLLLSREVLDQNLSRVDRETLESEIKNLEERLVLADAESALARSLRGTLEIQKKRLENLLKSQTSLEVVDAELERIEHQVVLIREEAAVSSRPEMLSHRLDAVSGALDETHHWMEQNASLFGDLGADPLGAAPADLPNLPELPPTPPPPPVKTRGRVKEG